MVDLTDPQKRALQWLQERGGSASCQGRNRQRILAAGDFAPFRWATWRGLIDPGLVVKEGRRLQLVTAP